MLCKVPENDWSAVNLRVKIPKIFTDSGKHAGYLPFVLLPSTAKHTMANDIALFSQGRPNSLSVSLAHGGKE
jgi:hypothetical protein